MSSTLTLTRTRLFVLILAVVATGCGALGGAGRDDRRGEPVALERLQVGSVYGIGSRFSTDGLEFSVDGFGAGLGNAEIATSTPLAGAKRSKDAPKTLRLSHATLRCHGRRTSSLEFDFTDNGGAVALELGGELRSAADFIALDGQAIGAVHIAVRESSTAGVRRGHVTLAGAIERFAIAGADLELADLRL